PEARRLPPRRPVGGRLRLGGGAARPSRHRRDDRAEPDGGLAARGAKHRGAWHPGPVAGGGVRPVTPHAEAERALALLGAAVGGSGEAAEQLGVLLPSLLPGDTDAAVLGSALALAVEVGAGGHAMAVAVLGALARGGVVPQGSHPDNIPAALGHR